MSRGCARGWHRTGGWGSWRGPPPRARGGWSAPTPRRRRRRPPGTPRPGPGGRPPAGAAVQVRDLAALERRLAVLLRRPAVGAERGEGARRVIAENQGATERTLELVTPLLQDARSG